MNYGAVGASIDTLLDMSPRSLELILDFASPLVDALQQATLLWVGYRLRSTSADVQSISRVTEANYVALHQQLGRSGSALDALVRRKSSTRETTSTSPGEREEPAP